MRVSLFSYSMYTALRVQKISFPEEKGERLELSKTYQNIIQPNPAYPDVKTTDTSIYQAATAPSAIFALRYYAGAHALYFEL